MPRDDKIRMRDGLVITGGLLLFYGILAIVYAEQLRNRSDFCPDGTWILISGVCYTVWKLLLPFILIGLGLLVTGLVAFRSKPTSLEGHLHHGTGSHFTLAWLISLVVVPSIAWIIQVLRQNARGTRFVLDILGEGYEHTFLLELTILVGLLMLVPFVGLYIAHAARRKAFLGAAEKALEEPEMALPHERGFVHPDAEEKKPTIMLEEDAWPQDREAEGTQCEAATETGACKAMAESGARFCVKHSCKASRKDGQPCQNQVSGSMVFCRVHAHQMTEEE